MRKPFTAIGLILGAGLLTLGGPAAAQGFGQVPIAAAPPEAPAAGAQPGAKDVSSVTVTSKKQADVDKDPNQVVCHSETVMGSLFPKKVCASRRALTERERNDQAAVRSFESGIVAGKQ